MKNLGIVLIVIGIVMLIYGGFSFMTKEKVVDLGPIEVNKEKTHNVNWPPIAGAVIIVAGIALVAINKRK